MVEISAFDDEGTEQEEAEAARADLLAIAGAQARRQAALFRLSAELAGALDEEEVCQRVVQGLHDTLGYDVLALMLVDETSGDRAVAAQIGYDEPPTPIQPGQGLSEQPLLDGRLQYTPDVTQVPGYYYGHGGSEVDVPVRIGDQVLGVLVAESRQTHAFSQDDFEMLTAAAQQAGLAIEKARLLAAERRRADELDALRTTIADITSELELPALLQAIVERAAGLLKATGGELGLYDETSQELDKLLVDYDSSHEAFEQTFQRYNQKRQTLGKRTIALHFEIKALATPTEWEAIEAAMLQLASSQTSVRLRRR